MKSLWNKLTRKKKKGLFRGEITWREVSIVLAGLVAATFIWEFMRIYQDEAAKKTAVILKVKYLVNKILLKSSFKKKKKLDSK
jgi:hypothetical protein